MNGEVDIDEMRKLEEMKRVILKKILSKGAMERLGRIKLVKPDLASQLELYLIQLYQSGKISEEISEEQIKLILDRLTSGKQFRILK